MSALSNWGSIPLGFYGRQHSGVSPREKLAFVQQVPLNINRALLPGSSASWHLRPLFHMGVPQSEPLQRVTGPAGRRHPCRREQGGPRDQGQVSHSTCSCGFLPGSSPRVAGRAPSLWVPAAPAQAEVGSCTSRKLGEVTSPGPGSPRRAGLLMEAPPLPPLSVPSVLRWGSGPTSLLTFRLCPEHSTQASLPLCQPPPRAAVMHAEFSVRLVPTHFQTPLVTFLCSPHVGSHGERILLKRSSKQTHCAVKSRMTSYHSFEGSCTWSEGSRSHGGISGGHAGAAIPTPLSTSRGKKIAAWGLPRWLWKTAHVPFYMWKLV